MKARWLLPGLAAVLVAAARVNAEYIVTTNMNGADAEVREDDINPSTNPAIAPVGTPLGTQRGASTELASRAKDSTSGSGDRSSAIYLKFDISDANGVTNALLGLANRTPLHLTTRNAAQLRWSRIHDRNPYYGTLPADDTNPDFVAFASDPDNYTRAKFNVYGLTNFAHPNYNWSESGIPAGWNPATSPTFGPTGSITWWNAPGITPDSRTTPAQQVGQYNFNSDMQLLGQATLEAPGLPAAVPPPYPSLPGAGSAALCVGCTAIEFDDTLGRLHDLIEAAKAAGQTHVTIALAFANNAFQNATGETAQVTPNNFLNFNYLFNPKEMDANTSAAGLTLNADPNWDPNWSDNTPAPGPTPPGPGPYSGASNDDGRFSPQLVFYVPEPGSFALVVIGTMIAAATGRRRK
jgi:hypothetical protein